MENHFIGSERWFKTPEFKLGTVKWGKVSNLEIEDRGDWEYEQEEMEETEEEEYDEEPDYEENYRDPYSIVEQVSRRECVNF